MPRFTGFVLRYFRDTNGSLMWMDLDSGIRIVNVYAPGDFRSQKEFFAVLDDHLVGPSRVVLDFGGSNFEVTFRNKVAVDRFLADSATIKVKETGIRYEYRGLRTVSVCVYEYPAEASDKVLSRALEVYGKVQNMSDDNLTGLRITTGNRRARMELRSPVPNIADVDGTSFGASTTALCACVPSDGCRVTKEKCAPRHGAHGASSGGLPHATRLASAAAGITLHTSASRGCIRRQPRGPVCRRSRLRPWLVRRVRARQRLQSRTKGSRAKPLRLHQEKPR
ncbi:hypothetical protein HPB51_004218 [Rhipicephalus microplus]|uniref:Uncharacterized protein n=1 Tax=Rhipicephalus microplus TaxID=6941 RepID=A0A9J6DZD7_RHIMP|nr:hypothetical protein HPB51_004218 [Rhipicephalus microplus]